MLIVASAPEPSCGVLPSISCLTWVLHGLLRSHHSFFSPALYKVTQLHSGKAGTSLKSRVSSDPSLEAAWQQPGHLRECGCITFIDLRCHANEAPQTSKGLIGRSERKSFCDPHRRSREISFLRFSASSSRRPWQRRRQRVRYKGGKKSRGIKSAMGGVGSSQCPVGSRGSGVCRGYSR